MRRSGYRSRPRHRRPVPYRVPPIVSARTRCSTRNCIATRPRSRKGAQARSDPALCRPAQGDGTTADDVASIEAAADQEVDAAVAFADAGTWESIDDPERDVHPCTGAGTMKTTYRTAVHDAIRDALRDDPRVVLMGEDVGRYGAPMPRPRACWRSSAPTGYAILRCRSWVSSASGSALNGVRPIVEVADGELQPAGSRPDRQYQLRRRHVRRPVRSRSSFGWRLGPAVSWRPSTT